MAGLFFARMEPRTSKHREEKTLSEAKNKKPGAKAGFCRRST